jgi:dynein heavy chain 1, cytosolic
MGANRTNIDPEKIPWDALKTLISQSVFGGKIDNEFDQKILASLVDKFFSPEVYNETFALFDPPVGTEEQTLVVPVFKGHKDYVGFIKQISLTETPAWSGLPNNVEKIVRERAANSLVTNIKIIQGTGDDLDSGASDSKDESKSAWLVQL